MDPNQPAPVVTTAPLPVKPKNNVLTLLVLFLLGIVLGGGLVFMWSESVDGGSKAEKEAKEEAQEVKPTKPELATKVCTSEYLKVSFDIPENWTCEVEDTLDDTGENTIASFVSIEGHGMSIEMSDLGRGGPCGMEEPCTITEIFASDVLSVSSYTQQLSSYSIFGNFAETGPDDIAPWISVNTDNDAELTFEQTRVLKDVLKSAVRL